MAEAEGRVAAAPPQSGGGTRVPEKEPERRRQFTPALDLSTAPRYAGGGCFAPIPSFGAARTPLLEVSEPDDPLEDEADRVAARVARRLSAAPGGLPADGAPPAPPSPAHPTVRLLQRASLVEVAGETAGVIPHDTKAGGLIVDDATETLTAGQMKKTRFLASLREVACQTAERELSRVGRSAKGCPYIEEVLSRYARRPAAALERAIHLYAPEARRATRAEEYLPAVSARLAQGVAQWARTGKMPEGLPDELNPGRLGDFLEAGVSLGKAVIAAGKALFKGKEGSARTGVDASALANRLGPGKPLDGGTRTRMEWAFGRSFGDVRVHADDEAAALARSLDARAFTVGAHVAFGAEEFRPGSPAGDALLAHELAHVAQQSGDQRDGTPVPASAAPSEAQERDADQSALAAVASIWGGATLAGRLEGRHARPRIVGHQRLSRCAAQREAAPVSDYDRALLEGTQLLKGVGFGVQWTKDRCDKPSENSFDAEFWEKVPGECKLRARTKTSLAVAAMFDPARKGKWKLDCEQFSQVVHFDAILKTRGPDDLDKLVGEHAEITPLAMRGRHALPTKALWGRATPTAKMKEHVLDKAGVAVPKTDGRELTIDELLAVTPFGSRVTFENGHMEGKKYAALQNFQFENTLLVGKDRYVEHPLVVRTGPFTTTNILTSDEIINMMAKASDPYTDESRRTSSSPRSSSSTSQATSLPHRSPEQGRRSEVISVAPGLLDETWPARRARSGPITARPGASSTPGSAPCGRLPRHERRPGRRNLQHSRQDPLAA